MHTSGIYDDLPPYVRAWQGEPGKPGGKVVRKAPTAADLLQIGRKAIYKLIHDGDLVGYKLNERVVLVEVASIQRYIDARRIVAPGKGA